MTVRRAHAIATVLIVAAILVASPGVAMSIFIRPADLAAKPTSGTGWDFLKSTADKAAGATVDLSNQNSFVSTDTLAAGLVAARTGDAHYHDIVVANVKKVPGTELLGTNSDVLPIARTLFGYVVAADLIGLPLGTGCNNGETWGHFLGRIRTTTIPSNGRWPTLERTAADTSSNWGSFALSSHLAVSMVLNDLAGVLKDAAIFFRILGDTNAAAAPFNPTSSYRYNGNGATWDMTPTLQRGINPASSDPRSGALIEDAMRLSSGGTDSQPFSAGVSTAAKGYQEESLDGIFSTAQLLLAAGVDVTPMQNQALRRAFDFYWRHGQSSYSVRYYLPYVINHWYGTSYPTSGDSAYRHMGFGRWLFS